MLYLHTPLYKQLSSIIIDTRKTYDAENVKTMKRVDFVNCSWSRPPLCYSLSRLRYIRGELQACQPQATIHHIRNLSQMQCFTVIICIVIVRCMRYITSNEMLRPIYNNYNFLGLPLYGSREDIFCFASDKSSAAKLHDVSVLTKTRNVKISTAAIQSAIHHAFS